MIFRIFLLAAFTLTLHAWDNSFDVVHRKKLLPDDRGVLKISQAEIRFEARDADRSRYWKYADIQFLDRLSPTELVIVTYGNVLRFTGRDKHYRFSLTTGKIDDALFGKIADRLEKPVSNRVFSIPAEGVRFAAGVKHLHRAGGCEGRLVFTAKAVYFESDSGSHSHEWMLKRDVASVWSADPLQLEVHARDPRSSIHRTVRFRFLLKQPLDPLFYRRLKLELHEYSSATADGRR